MSRRTIASLAVVLVAIALGVLREFLFVNLNYQLDFVTHHRAFSYAHSKFQAWVEGWELRELSALKWALAVLFTAANLALAVLLARVRVGDHRYRSALVFGFVTIGTLALIAHGLSGQFGGLRYVSVKLLHALQYPVLLLIVWAASWLKPR